MSCSSIEIRWKHEHFLYVNCTYITTLLCIIKLTLMTLFNYLTIKFENLISQQTFSKTIFYIITLFIKLREIKTKEDNTSGHIT